MTLIYAKDRQTACIWLGDNNLITEKDWTALYDICTNHTEIKGPYDSVILLKKPDSAMLLALRNAFVKTRTDVLEEWLGTYVKTNREISYAIVEDDKLKVSYLRNSVTFSLVIPVPTQIKTQQGFVFFLESTITHLIKKSSGTEVFVDPGPHNYGL